MPREHRRVWVLVVVLAVVAVVGGLELLDRAPPRDVTTRVPGLVLATILAVVELRPVTVRLRGQNHFLTMSEALLVVALLASSSTDLLVGMLLGVLPSIVRDHVSPVKSAFNFSSWAAAIVLGGVTFHALAPAVITLGPSSWGTALLGATAAWLLGAMFVRVVLGLVTGQWGMDREAATSIYLSGAFVLTAGATAVASLLIAETGLLHLVLLLPAIVLALWASNRQATEAERARILHFVVAAGERLRVDPDPSRLVQDELERVREAFGGVGAVAVLAAPQCPVLVAAGDVRRTPAGDAVLLAALEHTRAWTAGLVGPEDGDLGLVVRDNGWRTVLRVPLVSGDWTAGYVLVGDRPRPFDREDVRFAGAVAAITAEALRRSWLGSQLEASRATSRVLEHAARHDPLTGLANRAGLADELERTGLERAAVLFLDLDGFKPINDRYGHDVGDVLLQVVAQRLRSATRPGDLVVRMGGDEFAVVLPETDDANARAIADRVLTTLRDPVVVRGGPSVVVGASVGIALHEYGVDAAEVLRRADQAMYAAKEVPGVHVRRWEPPATAFPHARTA